MTPYLIQKKVLVGGMLNFTKPGGPVHLDIPSQESESDACRYGNHRAAPRKNTEPDDSSNDQSSL